MARKDDDERLTVVKQDVYPVPDIPIKELLDAIPCVFINGVEAPRAG